MSRVWSDRPDLGGHQCSGVLRRSLINSRGQRTTAFPTEDKACGPAQASTNTGPPSGHNRYQAAGINNIPSCPSSCLTNRPSTSLRHANVPSHPDPCTSAAHLRHHIRGIVHGS